MKQNYFKHLLAALLLLCTTAASAHDFVVDGIYYNIKDAVNKTVEVTYKGISHSEFFDEYTGDVVIPGIVFYNDVTYSVASIGESAFKICSELTSIKIPNNITSIGDDAFYGCTGLKEIYVFSEEPATIKSKTFSYHSATLYVPVGARSAYANASYWADFTNITEYVDKDLVFEVTSEGKATVSVTAYTGNQPIVAIPSHYTIDGKTYTVTSLGRYTFDGCTSLTSIVIPNSVTSIGSYTFRGCSALTSVHISDLAAWCNIDFGIFYNPNAIKAPENRGVAKIPPGYYGFATNPLTSALYLNGELVKNLVIPDGIKKIKSGAFYGYRGLESVEIPNSVTNIEEFAFSFCSGLTSVEISNSVTSIGTCAFEGCTGLTSIEIPGSVTSIGNEAFRGCTGLTSIEIPGSVTSIGRYAFDGCTGLKEVHISDIAAWCGIDFGSGSANPLCYAKNLYFNDELVTELVIPEGIKEIRDYAFYGFTGFTSIEIPNSVTSIEDYVFYGCSRLISIEIPNSVTEIGVCAFNGTAWYDNLPDGVVYAGNVLYKYKGTMLSNTSIAVKDGTVCIADSAFSYCTGLTAIEIPGSVTMIGNSAFFGCKSLKDLRIEDGEGGLSLGYNRYNMASLGVGLFSACPLETLYLGRDLYYISDLNYGYSPFEYIETLTSITIGNNVTGFGRSLFRGCTGLTAVYISDLAAWCGIGFDDIYANPLYYAKKLYLNGELLTELVIPEGVEWIRRYAFSNCSSLTSVEIPNSVTFIGQSAFEGCSSLTSAEIPNSVTEIGSKAFLGCTGLKEIYSLSAEPATIYDDTFDNYSATLNVLLGSKSAYEKADYWKNFTNIVEILDKDLVFTITSEVDATVAVTGYTGNQTIVTIPSHYTIDGKSYTVTSIGESAFNSCKGLKSIVIPNSVKSISALAFDGCTGLKEVHINDLAAWCGIDFKSSSDNPLYYAKNLCLNGELVTELVIPEGVKEIKFSAFRYCTSFTSIEFPNSVTNIGAAAFSDCPGLSSITVAAGNTKYDSRENSNAIIETATNTLIAGCKNTKIPNSVESIGRFAFCGCTGLTSIEIPNSVESIGRFAFGYCSGLTSIVIPDSVAFIDEFAFIECTGLTKIVVTEDNTVYDSRNNCNAIIETATNSLILGCQNTVIPNSVTSIGKYAFSYCSGLTAIEIPNSVKSIGDNAFYYCSGLTNVVIGNSVESIGRNAFDSCTSLTAIEIPGSVTSIGGWAFSGCNGLTNVVIGNGVTSIGKDAFAFCFRITSIKIPDSVTSIEDGAFRYCSGLKEIHSLSAKPATIQSSTFDNYSATLYVPAGAKSAYEKAAYWKNFTNIVEILDKDLVFTITSEEDATVAVTGYTGNQATVTIPSHYVIDGKRYTVTAIGEYAFDRCRGLTSIEIPNSVTSIGEYAFRSCSGLTSVEIPNSITSIGYNAFVLCTGLKGIEIPASVTNLENSAFSSCSGLESIVVAEGNTVYDSRNNCNAIIETATNTLVLGCQNTIIPGSVTSIGHSSFYMCSGLTSIEIPNSVTTIEDYAFGYCTGLASIEIPKSVTSIGVSVFEKCTGLTSLVIGNGVTSIGSSAFDDCDGLKEVHMNDLAAWCGIDFGNRDANPLYYAKKLYLNGEQVTELVIPVGVKDIKNYTFSNCSGLASVEIPASVTSIGEAAFSYCPGLSSITVAAGNTKYDSRENSNAIIETATNTLVAGCKNTIIPNSVTSIGDNAFQGCEGLTSIVIPNSVESIGWNAFYGCAGLKLVLNYSDLTFRIGSSEYGYIAYYADKVTNAPNGFVDGDFVWGENVYTGSYILCSYLGDATELTLPADCKGLNYEIGEAVFYGRTGLTSVVIPNGVTGIGDNAFYGCTGLTNIVIPNSVTFIGNSAFYGCTGLTNIVIPNSVTFIGDYTFSGCYGLTSVTIPNSVTFIGDYAFYGCSRLTSVTIPNSVTSIGDYAFRNCGGLTSVTIGNSVESIGDYAFRNCDELTSVELPAALTCIGEEAFARCSLTTIVIPANVKSIGNNAFADNRKLTEVTSLISAEKLFAIPAIMSRAYYRRCTLYVNIGAKETYAVTEGWNQFKDIVEMDLSAIEDVLADGLSDADAVFYDLNGRVVEYPTNGIYIVNGKKVFVK